MIAAASLSSPADLPAALATTRPATHLPGLLRHARRSEPRLTTLLFLQWIGAVLAALWWPGGSPHHLLLVLLAEAAATGGCAALSHFQAGSRVARAGAALCQMFLAIACRHLFDDCVALAFYSYASLVLISVTADWEALLLACAAACADVLISAPVTAIFASPTWPPGVRERIAGEIASLLLCTGLLSYVTNERRAEASEATVQREAARHTLYRAFHDSCTGLPNRAALESCLEDWLQQGASVSCLWLEVDGICAAESPYGMRNVEDLVRSVAAGLQHTLEEGDLLGRVGNDRFCILTQRPRSREQLEALAVRIIQQTGRPHTVAGRAVDVSINIGIAAASRGATAPDALLMVADRAMRVSQTEERNQFRFADDLCSAAEQRSHVISQKLQQALQADGLRLVYQPIFNADHQMIAAEALARWTDAELGEVSPGEFVPAAEAHGLIVPFSRWVMRQACAQMVEWLQLGGTLQRIAVNVSVKQAGRGDFVPAIEQTLRETGLEPRHLEVEVTEGTLAADFEPVKLNLQALRRLGVRISIDDFGTGYSSLSRVRELEADVLKIDRAFVKGASESPCGAAMVQTIIDMAHNMQLSVIAEGVETADQLQMLQGMSCDEIQGFLLARPQPPEVLTQAMRRAPSAQDRNEPEPAQSCA